MLNRNNIFKTVRDTENTLNVSTGRKMDNFYTELLQYENTAQRRYDKIKNILESIRYHHNKIQNINKKYSNAIYGGSDDSDKLLKAIELAIDNIEILDSSLTESQFNTLIDQNIKALIYKIGVNTADITKLTINEEHNITENSFEFFDTAVKELDELKKALNENDQNISKILKHITDVEPLLMKYINENKLVTELRENILNGFKAIKSEISQKQKENSDKFTSYSTSIKNALTYAKANKNAVKSVDQQILTAFLNDPKKVVFKKDSVLEINQKKTDIVYDANSIENLSEKNKKDLRLAKIISSEFELEFIIDKSDTSIVCKLTPESFIKIINSKKFNRGPIELFKKAIHKDPTFIAILKNDSINENEVLDIILRIAKENSKTYVKFINDTIDKNINLDLIPKFIDLFKKEQQEKEQQEKEQQAKKQQAKKGGGGGIKDDPSILKLKEILTNIKSRILNNIGNNFDKKDKDKDKNKDKDNTTTNTNEPNTITNSIISSIIKNYEEERKNVNSIDQKIKLDAKFVDYLDNLGLNLADIFKINLNDKFAFIFFILILHISVYSIIESLIMNDYISGIVYIMAAYVGVYIVIMLVLILILNKYVNYRIKATLNYLNTDFNIYLITMHLFIVFMFYIVVLLLSQHIDIFVAKDEDDKLQILYRIEVISSIIFIFSSVFIMLL